MTLKVLIETPRLLLREFSLSDAPGFHAMNADAEVLRYTGDEPFADLAAAEAFIRSYDHYRRYGYGRWTVLRKADQAYLGFCGFKYDPDLDETDLGFRLPREYWGQGYATEAARACLSYGFQSLGLEVIVGRARRDNLASVRVLKKTGFTYWKDFLFDGEHPGVYYRIRRNG